jgi:hypothetical protein
MFILACQDMAVKHEHNAPKLGRDLASAEVYPLALIPPELG